MAKTKTHAYSRYSQDAVLLLGQMIRLSRIERKLTVADLAERIGASRGLIQRIERGDAGCSIGAVFEAAVIVGIKLFDMDQTTLTDNIESHKRALVLLPKAARSTQPAVRDDF